MAIPTSTIDTVKDYLVTNITTQINDTSVLVTYDPPGEYQPDDIVVVGDVITWDGTPHAFVGSGGTHWIHEIYRVQVVISVYRGGDNASTTWKRAKALSDSVDVAVRTDPTLGGAVQIAYPATAVFTATWEEAHKGRIVEVRKEIHVEAET